MPRSRTEFHEELCALIHSRNVYFQPPSSVYMKYPCLVYSLDNIDKHPADNTGYITEKRYNVIAISTDPDSELQDILLKIPYSRFVRSYTADNLYHWVFAIYY